MTPRHPLYADVPDQFWSSWIWQQQNRLVSLDEIGRYFELTATERRVFDECAAAFKVSLTPYYASLIDPEDARCPIRLQSLPGAGELQAAPYELPDPLAEERYSPVPGVTHRYPDRAFWQKAQA